MLSSPVVPGTPGGQKKVLTTPELHKQVKPYLKPARAARCSSKATKYHLPVGKQVVVIGAGLHGMEVAEFLAKRGRKVTDRRSRPT